MGVAPPKRAWVERLPAAVALAGAAALLGWRLTAPFGGYHGFQEGRFASLGRTIAAGDLFPPAPFGGMPLGFAWLLGGAFAVGGVHEWVARLVCAAGFAGLLWQTAFLARRFDAHVPTTVACAASMPMLLVLAQNVQADLWYIFLGLTWWRMAVEPERRRGVRGLAAGLVAGAAWLVKPFVLYFWTAGAATQTLRGRSLRWLVARPVLVGAGVTLALVVPYYVAQTLLHPQASQGIAQGVDVGSELPSLDTLLALGIDLAWGVGPGVLVAGVTGMALVLWWRSPSALPLSMLAGAFVGAYWLLHYHTYYIAGLAPAIAIAAGLCVRGWPQRPRAVVVSLFVAWGLAYAAVVLLAKEVGQTAFAQAGAWIRERAPGGARIIMPARLFGSYSPELLYYADPAEFVVPEHGEERAPSTRPVFRIDVVAEEPRAGRLFVGAQTRFILRAGGRAYRLEPGNLHVFQPPALAPAPDVAPDGLLWEREWVPWVEVRGVAGTPASPAPQAN